MGANGGSGEFGEWLRGRGSAGRAAGSVHVQEAPRSTVIGEVVVPMLQALGMGVVVGLALLGILPVLGVVWGAAWRWAVGLGLGLWALTTVRFVSGQRAVRRAPMALERDKLEWLIARAGEGGARGDKEPWRLFRPPGARRPARPGLRAGEELPALPVGSRVVEEAVAGVEPEVDPETKRLYSFITRVWPGQNVSRRACMGLGFSRSEWERLVGGRPERAGSESGRGLLDRAEVVEKGPSGWVLAEGVTLEQALSITDELWAYAEARAELVRIGGGVGWAGWAGMGGRRVWVGGREGGVGWGRSGCRCFSRGRWVMTMTRELTLLERIEQGQTVASDAVLVRGLMVDLEEIVTGVHRCAQEGLAALMKCDLRTVRYRLEKLRDME